MTPETAHTLLCWLWSASGLLVIAVLIWGLLRDSLRGATPPTVGVLPPELRHSRRCNLCDEMTATDADLCMGCHMYICPDCNEEPQGNSSHSPLAHMAPHDNGGSDE